MAPAAAQYYKRNRLKQLRAFCHTARVGSISRAAERLYLSQPSVSLQIQALERELGVKLFERHGPKIRLTPEGESLYQLAQPLVSGIDTLHETFKAQHGRLEHGELNIAASESTILYILPQPVKAFAEQYPGIDVKLHNVTARDSMAMVQADEADFAVGSTLDVPDDTVYRPLATYYPVLITPVGHALAERQTVELEDISQYGLILSPRHLSTWRIVDIVFGQRNVRYKVTLEAGGWEVIKKYVALGLGISIVTDVCLTGAEPLARIPLARFFPERTYGIAYRRGKFLSPQAKKFIEILNATLSTRVGTREAAVGAGRTDVKA